MKFCSNCGKEWQEGSKFCAYCGAKGDSIDTTQQPQSQSVQQPAQPQQVPPMQTQQQVPPVQPQQQYNTKSTSLWRTTNVSRTTTI